MLPAWLVPVITIASMIFSAGVTWGILSYKQKNSESTQSSLVADLKSCVQQLQGLVTEVQLIKASTSRYERDSEDHDKRIGKLEVDVGRLARTRTKR